MSAVHLSHDIPSTGYTPFRLRHLSPGEGIHVCSTSGFMIHHHPVSANVPCLPLGGGGWLCLPHLNIIHVIFSHSPPNGRGWLTVSTHIAFVSAFRLSHDIPGTGYTPFRLRHLPPGEGIHCSTSGFMIHHHPVPANVPCLPLGGGGWLCLPHFNIIHVIFSHLQPDGRGWLTVSVHIAFSSAFRSSHDIPGTGYTPLPPPTPSPRGRHPCAAHHSL